MTKQEILDAGLAAARKISAANAAVASQFIGRAEVALAFWLALVADRASFLLGPPGVGKTAVTQFLAKLVSGLRFYEELMPTVVSPEQLLVAETTIEETPTPSGGKAIRVSSKMGNAADAHLVFLDEIWKTQPAVAKVLFDLLMADGIRLGGQFIQTPTLGVVTASNELPEPGNQLEALWSRMAFRFFVRPLDRAGKKQMLVQRQQLDAGNGGTTHHPHGTPAPAMGVADVEAMQAARPLVSVPEDLMEIVLGIAYDLHQSAPADFDWLISDDRRFEVIRQGLQAHALIHGRGVATKADLSVLRYMLWDKPEQIATVEGVLAPYCRTPIDEARQIVDELMAAGGHLSAFAGGEMARATKAMAALAAAKAELNNLSASATGSDAATIQKWIASFGTLSGKVATGATDPANRAPWDEITALFR